MLRFGTSGRRYACEKKLGGQFSNGTHKEYAFRIATKRDPSIARDIAA
jgi:hypothetical protein